MLKLRIGVRKEKKLKTKENKTKDDKETARSLGMIFQQDFGCLHGNFL